MASVCFAVFAFLCIFPDLSRAQPAELMHSISFTDNNGWTETNSGRVSWRASDDNGCDQLSADCVRTADDPTGRVTRSIDTTNYHSVFIVVDVYEDNLDSDKECRFRHRASSSDSWSSFTQLAQGGDGLNLNEQHYLPDTTSYNDQQGVELQFNTNSGSDNKYCYFANLEIWGVPYTNNPTTDPSRSPSSSPTKQPTSTPSQSPTKQPTSTPTRSPTNHPSSPPTKSPSESPTESTSSPSNRPSVTPTKVPSRYPSKTPTPAPVLVVPEGTTLPSTSPISTSQPTSTSMASDTEDGNDDDHGENEAALVATSTEFLNQLPTRYVIIFIAGIASCLCCCAICIYCACSRRKSATKEKAKHVQSVDHEEHTNVKAREQQQRKNNNYKNQQSDQQAMLEMSPSTASANFQRHGNGTHSPISVRNSQTYSDDQVASNIKMVPVKSNSNVFGFNQMVSDSTLAQSFVMNDIVDEIEENKQQNRAFVTSGGPGNALSDDYEQDEQARDRGVDIDKAGRQTTDKFRKMIKGDVMVQHMVMDDIVDEIVDNEQHQNVEAHVTAGGVDLDVIIAAESDDDEQANADEVNDSDDDNEYFVKTMVQTKGEDNGGGVGETPVETEMNDQDEGTPETSAVRDDEFVVQGDDEFVFSNTPQMQPDTLVFGGHHD